MVFREFSLFGTFTTKVVSFLRFNFKVSRNFNWEVGKIFFIQFSGGKNVKKRIVRNFSLEFLLLDEVCKKIVYTVNSRKILAFRVGMFFLQKFLCLTTKGGRNTQWLQRSLNKSSLVFNIPQRRTSAIKSVLTKKLKTCRCYAARSDSITSRADCVFLYKFPRTNDEYVEQKRVNKAHEKPRGILFNFVGGDGRSKGGGGRVENKINETKPHRGYRNFQNSST